MSRDELEDVFLRVADENISLKKKAQEAEAASKVFGSI
jgi:hypothetical protein